MILTPVQSKIASDKHRFRVVNCGRRFGKTTLAVLEMVAKAIYGDNRQICYIAPTYQQARDIAWQELKKICLPAINKVNESRLEITVNTVNGGTSTISLRGWESIETLRGQKFHFIVIDEVASVRNWFTNWQEVIRPTLTDFKGEALFISTPKGFNHFYDIFNLQNTDPDYKSFHATTYDNPHVPAEEVDKAKRELTEDRFAQEYLADFRKTEGLVYKEFDRNRHLFDDYSLIIQPKERIAGLDFGFTNPTAIPSITVDFDNHLWITSEYYKTGQTIDQVIEYLNGSAFNKIFPDPENPEAIEQLRKAKLPIREVIKGKDSVQTGIQMLREMFKTNRIHIHVSCVNLIWELETYCYPEKKPDRNEQENPIKENDHLLDALRMVVLMYSPKQAVHQYRPQYVNPNQLPVAARVAKHYRPSHL